MHFARAGLAHHADDLAAGGAAHDGIVHQNHALAFQQVAHRVQLELHAEIADRLRRLDERAAHVVIADQRLPERNAGFGGIADGGGDAGIGHRHDDVGIDGMLRAPAGGPAFSRDSCHRAAEDDRIGPREIDVLEDALRAVLAPARSARASALRARRSPSRPARRRADRPRRSDRRRRFRKRTRSTCGRPDNSSWPIASGRKPCGSRATMMRSSARNTSENAPSSCSSASRKRAGKRAFARARHQVQDRLRYRWRPGKWSRRAPARGAARRRW